MAQFPNALQAWPSESFARVLKDEIESMDSGILPLDAGVSQGGFVGEADITAIVLASGDEEHAILAEVGVFFTEIVAGCSCGDDPDAINTYCRLRICIDKASAEAEIRIVPD